MSQLLGSNFKRSIIDQIIKCSRSITIISPYVTLPAVKELAKALPGSVKRRCLVTSPPGVEYVTGSVDIEALEILRQIGFEIRCLPDLHAKIYLLDEKNAYIGSANFTSNGWGLSRSSVKGNVEDMIMIETSKSDRDHIISRYIINSDALDLNGDWKIEVEKYKVQFLNQYLKLMNSMVINYSTQEFSMYSDYQKPPNGYKCYFRFSIAKTTGNKIKKEKKNIILKLGGEKQTPHATISIPFNKFGRYLTSKYSTENREDWQFRLYFDHEQNITLKIKDEVIVIPNNELKGVLSVEFKKVENNKILN